MKPESVPFREFARHYDRFMGHYVDYRSWVNYVERIFERFKVVPETVLDVACGTGIPSLLLARRGCRVIGVDRSEEMLAVLRAKVNGLPVTTLRADITDFALPEPVDAAISLYDSINYLLAEEDLVRCFTCVHRALNTGGVFVFDMNTLYSLSVFWGDRVAPRNAGGIESTWDSRYDPATRVSTLRLHFREPTPNGGFAEFDEVHRERAYSRHEVKRSLKAAGFSRVRFYTHGGFLPVGPLTIRMMVVAH
ncbi:MAG TPA: class I SAM-dependent methyltransferase [candidate division WOR-3 bacterium]|uniref:Class I SAM-dependent methyltransferase n=1 Tax=candidate division WOR-3 bacterium TaxID=2052148 RepID=A0A7V0XFE9_UNCW3|nr:class I SAM-dependent methyltransferase [candidate division WOR-3 bacterium]